MPWMKAATSEPPAKPTSQIQRSRSRLVAELEGHAAQDQARQHEQQRQIEGREQRRIDDRKGAPQDDAGHHEPGLVAVPDRRHRAQHRAPPRLVARQAEQHADAEIEPVEQHVEQNADGQDGDPEHDHGYSPAATWCSVARAARRRPTSGGWGLRRRAAGPGARRAGAQQPVDVEDAEGEDEAVDRAKDDERDRRRARRQERRHRVGGSQHAVDRPGLAPDLGGEPAGQDRDERQRKAEEDQPEQQRGSARCGP